MTAAPPTAASAVPRRPIHIHMDAHVHIYPSYNLPRLLLSALDHMPRLTPTDLRILCLAERADCTFFQSLAQDEISLPADAWRIIAWDPEGGVKIRHRPTHRDLWILAGRQIVTAENIEICSLFSDLPVPDHLDARSTLRAIREANGLPALDWAFGKWTFSRGSLVRALLRENPPETLLLIDTAMRPRHTPAPRPYAAARRTGRPLLAGSDPLPTPAEDQIPGTYFTTFTLPPPADSASIIPVLRAHLTTLPLPSPMQYQGRRNTLLQALRRRRL